MLMVATALHRLVTHGTFLGQVAGLGDVQALLAAMRSALAHACAPLVADPKGASISALARRHAFETVGSLAHTALVRHGVCCGCAAWTRVLAPS